MVRIVRHNDESVREGYIRNDGKEVKLFTSALKDFQCNNRIHMAPKKHLHDFLRNRIIKRLECGRTQLEVSKELGIAQSVISRLWQQFQDDGNAIKCYSTGHPRVTTLNDDRYLDVTAKRNKRSTASDLSRQLSSATGTTVSIQTVYRRLEHIGLYARRPVRCVPLTATYCRLLLTWMPGTRYRQENIIERHRYGGAGWLVWGGIILGSRTDLNVQSLTMTGHIYRYVIQEKHVRLFWGAIDAEFLFMDDNARPHRANIVDDYLQSEDITRRDWPAYSPDFNPKDIVLVKVEPIMEASGYPEGVLHQICGCFEPNRTVTCKVLIFEGNDRHTKRTMTLHHDEFLGSRSDINRSGRINNHYTRVEN
ncbi:transposable element Tcb1 transposase [Trichonephila clavipes]|uniref:Transposable element Tcb1 transposase n=1 Tax=Trichonephila clavipes TaxID=2585209 RepID=A0A8X6W1U8_TRICX|nr:transposable element Tcb1 transposase [Trichonephila clavipes]